MTPAPHSPMKPAVLAMIGIAAAACAPIAAAQSRSDEWCFALTPYLWLPAIDGNLRFNVPGNPSASTDPNSYLDHLKFAAMLAGEARRGPWSISGDLFYVDFGKMDSALRSVAAPGGGTLAVDAQSQLDLRAAIVTVTGGYALLSSPDATLDVLAGVRYGGIKAALSWDLTGPLGSLPRTGSASGRDDYWEAVLGFKGRLRLGASSRWTLPYGVDAGAGGDSRSWSAYGGIGYRYDWGHVLLAYRALGYRMDVGAIEDLTLQGPALGVSFGW